MTMPAVFELITPDEQPQGLVGPWQLSSADTISFGPASESVPPEVPVWRVHLPAQPQQAESELDEAAAQLAAAQASLEEIPARLQQLASPGLQPGGPSFDVPASGIEPGSPEAQTMQLLAAALALEAGQPVSYGLEGLGSQALEQARAAFHSFVSQLQREVLNLAWVETHIDARLLARSIIGWSGDSQTAWEQDVSLEQMQLHRRSLDIAVQSRLLRIRIFCTVSAGAAKLSVLFTTPVGAMLALPAAWKYVDEILRQIKTYQTLTQGAPNGK